MLMNMYGQQKAAKEARDAQGLVNNQIADLTAWRNTSVNQPYLDSNAGRGVITKAFNKFRDQAQQAQSTAAVTGASDEAVVAQQGNAQAALGNVMSDVSAQGTIRADQIENQYRSNLANLLLQKMGLIQQQGQSGANLASSAGSFMAGLAPTFAKSGGGISPELATDMYNDIEVPGMASAKYTAPKE
jgi:hypothetical protein